MTENINNLAKELTQLSETKPELVKSIIDEIMNSLSEGFFEEGNFTIKDNSNGAVAAGTINPDGSENINTNVQPETESNENITVKNENVTVNPAAQEIGDKLNDNREIQSTANEVINPENGTQISDEDGKVVVRHNTDIAGEGRQTIQPQAD